MEMNELLIHFSSNTGTTEFTSFDEGDDTFKKCR